MQRLIFFDIDNTLFADNSYVPERTLRGIARAKAAGHLVFLNTGRTKSILPREVTETVKPDGLVCGLGTYVELHGRVLRSVILSHDDINRLAAFAVEHDTPVYFEGETASVAIGSYGWWGDENSTFSIQELWEKCPEPRYNKVTVQRRISDEQVAALGFDACHAPWHSELVTHGYGKADGIRFLCRELGFDPQATIAFGDGENDLDMLAAAAVPVAMENGCDAAKALAVRVAPPCRDGGVGIELERILFGKEME